MTIGLLLLALFSALGGALLTIAVGIAYVVRTPIVYGLTVTNNRWLWRLQGAGIGVLGLLVALLLWIFVIWPLVGPLVDLILAIIGMALGG